MIKAKSQMLKAKNRGGQVLLIAVMLLATVITVVMTIAFNATTETQVARLEVDSQKALAAAEAGIDAVIKQSINTSVPVDIGTLGEFSEQKISGSAQVVGVSYPYFVSPLLQKDEQYTFYLSEYLSEAPWFQNPWSGELDIFLVSESGQCPSIEVTVIDAANAIEKYAYDTCAAIINGAITASEPGTPVQIDGVNFKWKIPTPLTITNGRIAFIKVLNGRTKLGFQSLLTLPIQGKTVSSEARTESGVVKRVQLFQSFPQIPSSFFMTSF